MRKTCAIILLLMLASLPVMGNIYFREGGAVWLSDGGYISFNSAEGIYVPVAGDITATMTGYTAPSPNIVTSYLNYGGAYYGWQAFDGDTADGARWQGSAAASGPYITYNWGTGTTHIVIQLKLIQRGATTDVKQFLFQGSNDGTSFTTLLTATAANSLSWQTFSVTNSTAYQMYRFWPMSTYGSNPAVRELEFWEQL